MANRWRAGTPMGMSKTRKVVLIISGIVIALVLACILGIAIIVSAFRGNPPSIRDNSVLVLRVAGPLPDFVPDDPFRRLFGGQPQSLNSLLAQLRKAKVDKRITAVLLEIDMPEAGWAKAEEIRGAIEDFRTSGKPVYAYMETSSQQGLLHRHRLRQDFCAAAGRVVHHRSGGGRDVLPRLARQAGNLSRHLPDREIQERGRHVHSKADDGRASRVHQLAARRSVRPLR